MARGQKPLIVIVEDEKQLSSMIEEQLSDADMLTQVFNDAEGALRFLSRNFANLVLLDITLPGMSGFEFFGALKLKNVQVPVIFLTGNDSEVNIVHGLAMGGDDYILKPFGFPELIARIHAVLRRTERAMDFNVTQNAKLTEKDFLFGQATVCPQTMELKFPNGACQKLGRKELGILVYLVSNPHTVLTRRCIIHAVWGVHADVRSRSLDQYIVKIRDYFSSHDCPLESLRTVHGVGYVYESEDGEISE